MAAQGRRLSHPLSTQLPEVQQELIIGRGIATKFRRLKSLIQILDVLDYGVALIAGNKIFSAIRLDAINRLALPQDKPPYTSRSGFVTSLTILQSLALERLDNVANTIAAKVLMSKTPLLREFA